MFQQRHGNPLSSASETWIDSLVCEPWVSSLAALSFLWVNPLHTCLMEARSRTCSQYYCMLKGKIPLHFCSLLHQ
jgi:hypothetical protein